MRAPVIQAVVLATWLLNAGLTAAPSAARPAGARGGKSLHSLEQSLAPLAARYGLTITATDPPKPAHKSIDYQALTEADLPSAEPYLTLFAEEWAKYPPGFVKA